MNRILGFFASALSLVALYLVLVNAAGATQLLKAGSQGTVSLFRTLQGR